LIEGHTDSDGSNELNQTLSQTEPAVKNYLIEKV
jgi:outer membrane protein OmpA-like peptidoglycan-associated protein